LDGVKLPHQAGSFGDWILIARLAHGKEFDQIQTALAEFQPSHQASLAIQFGCELPLRQPSLCAQGHDFLAHTIILARVDSFFHARMLRAQFACFQNAGKENGAGCESIPQIGMAKILGESGRYVSDQVMAKEENIRLAAVLFVGVAGVLVGMILGRTFLPASVPSSVFIPISLILLAVLFWLFNRSIKNMDKLAKERIAMQRGATGEARVGRILASLPDGYYVIHDLSTEFGNLDHVVVGPSGVFVIDTKNCRGVVAADGKGELLVNRKPTEKLWIRPFVSRMMNIREKIKVMAPGRDIYYDPLFVFTSAFVEAQWGATGAVRCVRDDTVFDYIVNGKFGNKLEPPEAERIAQAFLALARMDKGFDAAPQKVAAAAVA
jgi:hypothetical protein